MSSGLPTLNKLRKPELAEIAERTNLTDFSDLNKSDLAVALDKHLSENRARLSNDKQLADYYKRLAAPARGGSPVKREPKVDLTPAEKKTPGRKPAKARENASSESEDTSKTPVKTPVTKASAQATSSASALRSSSRTMRSVIESTTQQLPPSPAIVTDAIDRQTTRMRENLESAWSSSGVIEYQHSLRSTLSSLKAIETITLLLEGGSVLKELIPLRYLTTTPAIEAIHFPSVSIKVPDLFVLLSASFWGPFTLWILSGFVLPLIAAYFINLSYQAAGGVRRGRSAANERASFDPLTFNIVKALIVYKVYVDRFDYFDVFSQYSIAKVDASVPGHWGGMLTGTAIGVIGTLYEAILRRH